jgi:DNA-binding beta-propeller fold protein YncE
MPLPVEGTSFLLAADDVNARLYATTSGPQDALVAFDLFDHAAVVHRSFPEDAELGAVTVAPGGLSVNVAYLLTGVMATYEAKDLVFSAVEYLWGIAMPMQLAYRPGTLDLFVTDFWATTIEGADTTHAVVRSPKVDWADGGFDFAWAPITLPASQTNFDGDSGAGVAFLPAQGLVMMVNSRGDELVAVDEDTRQPLATAATASMPFFMAADPDSDAELGRVFVSHLQSGNLGVYTVTTGPTGGVTLEQEKRFNPCDAGHVVKPVFGDDPDTVYVLCTDGVTVLDADTLTVERHIALGGGYETDMVWVSR